MVSVPKDPKLRDVETDSSILQDIHRMASLGGGSCILLPIFHLFGASPGSMDALLHETLLTGAQHKFSARR